MAFLFEKWFESRHFITLQKKLKSLYIFEAYIKKFMKSYGYTNFYAEFFFIIIQ